jgi:hypothetical protein
MQTFLPYADFDATARCLDDRRLGKQRVEAMQILNVLDGRTRGWRNHPAVLMWRGYEDALRLYMNACINEWVRRGRRNNMSLANITEATMPHWLGDERVHSAYRAMLRRKDPSHYGTFNWTDEADDYFWPVSDEARPGRPL